MISVVCGLLLAYGFYVLLNLISDMSEAGYIKAKATVTKGIITGRHPNCKESISVRYKVKGKIYDAIDDIKMNTNVIVGDSIIIKYLVDKPDVMITEFNKGFK